MDHYVLTPLVYFACGTLLSKRKRGYFVSGKLPSCDVGWNTAVPEVPLHRLLSPGSSHPAPPWRPCDLLQILPEPLSANGVADLKWCSGLLSPDLKPFP